MKDRYVKDAAEGAAEDVPQDVAHNLAFGARVLAQLALRWARNWEGKWHLARAVGKRFRGCHPKRLYVHLAHARVYQCPPQKQHASTELAH